MRIVQALSHSIEEYDMLRMYASLGIECLSLTGYIDPRNPHDDKRPAVPEMPFFPELKAAVDRLGTPDNLRAAQERIPDEVLDWLGDDGAVVFHHLLDDRLIPQWPRLRDWKRGHAGRRVIWRSVGQSVDGNEAAMRPLVREGVERVAYSPKEANIPGYTGHAALIRFSKDPAEWYGWTGSDAVVGNVTQHMVDRAAFCNAEFYLRATEGLPAKPAGPGSERLPGGIGALGYDQMREYLRGVRAYLYVGTQPASYTLGLIEALMTGVPVISIGPKHMNLFGYGPEMFEGHEIALYSSDDPANARTVLRNALENDCSEFGQRGRQRAVELFGKDRVAADWARFLGLPERVDDVVTGTAEPLNVEPVGEVVPEMVMAGNRPGRAA